MTDIVERLQYWAFKFCGKGEREDIASDAMTDGWREIERLRDEVDHLHKMTIEWSKLHMEDVKETERLREANKRLGEIATDAVGWLPPASVNGPREEYQSEIKELTDGHC